MVNVNTIVGRNGSSIAAQFHEPLRERLTQRFDGELPASLREFADLFWKRIASDEVAYFALDGAVGTTLSCWHFVSEAAESAIRWSVHNPTFGRDGWDTSHTVVQVLHPDMPFLTDSLLMELTRQQLTVHYLQNVVLHIERNVGELPAFRAAGAQPHTLIYIETDRIDDAKCDSLAARLSTALTEVRAAVGDFQPMKAQARRLAQQLRTGPTGAGGDSAAGTEAAAFLDWLVDDHFTFLGYRTFVIDANFVRPEPDTSLGVFRLRAPASRKRLTDLQDDARAFLLEATLLSFSKSGTRSRVHRPAYPDYVMVKELNARGEVVLEHDFQGLYTSTVYAERPNNIPVVRGRIAAVLRRSQLDLDAFDGKNLVAAIAGYPRDELFLCSEDELFNNAMGIAQLHERRRVKLFLRRDRYGLFYSALVFVPRDRFNTQLRIAIQRVLSTALGALDVQFDSVFSESVLVRTQFVLRVDPTVNRAVDEGEIEQQLIALARDWGEDFNAALTAEFGEQSAREYSQRFLDAFPTSYREQFAHRAAAYDVRHMTRLAQDRDLVMRFYREPQDEAHRVHLKLYHLGIALPLSDVLPMLENLGLRVVDEHPYRLTPASGEALSIQDFVLDYVAPLDLRMIGDTFETAFVAIWARQVDDGAYNRLVLAAHLDIRGVDLLRAYGRYLQQIRFGLSQNFIADSLVRYPQIAAGLVELFRCRFTPERDPGAGASAVRAALLAALDHVELLNEDRVLRRYLELIEATLRTNFFQWDAAGNPKPYLALKLDPNLISDMPKPAPAYEIFVFSRRVEGVHLRNGRIARGGLRWSDRLEDYRTEVLGLVKAQVVKNAVIVPTGAKGGFVLKHPPSGDREALQQEAQASMWVPPSCRRRGSGDTTATIPISLSRPTRAPPPSLTSPTNWPRRDSSGWATRLLRVVVTATTTNSSR